MISGVLTGSVNNENWIKKPEVDFFTVKGVVQNLISLMGLENRIRFEECKDKNFLHPGKSAKVVLLGKKPETVGFFGEVHPILKDKQKFLQNVYLFELDLETLLAAVHVSVPRFKKLPQFPEVQRDLAFVVPENVSHDEISRIIKKAVQNNLFNGDELFDVYQGEHIKDGFKSMAYRIRLQDKEATLTDEAVEGEMKKIRENLQKFIKDLSFRE